MTNAGEMLKGVIALLIGGFLFWIIGSAFAGQISMPLLIDLRLWGIIYIVAAVFLFITLAYLLLNTVAESV